jgi:phage shock protein A
VGPLRWAPRHLAALNLNLSPLRLPAPADVEPPLASCEQEEIRLLRERLHALSAENAEKAALIAQLEATIASLQGQLKDLQGQIRAAMLALAAAKAQVSAKVLVC